MRTTTRKSLPMPDITDAGTSTFPVGTGARATTVDGVVRDVQAILAQLLDYYADVGFDEVVTGRWEFQQGILADKGAVVMCINNTGGARAAGDVVMFDPAVDNSIVLPNMAALPAAKVGIVAEAIAIGALGRVTLVGLTQVLVTAGTTRGQYLQTQNASAIATGSSILTGAAFGIALTAPNVSNFVTAIVHAGGGGGGLEVKTLDGTTDVAGTQILQFPNGSLTNNGGQNLTINFGSSLLKSESYTNQSGATLVIGVVPDTVLMVAKNGLAMQIGTDVTVNAATRTLTFTTALSGDTIDVVYVQTNNFPASAAPSINEFDPAGGATTVTLTSVPTVIMFVIRNGVPQSQAKGDWSWNSGTAVVTFTDAFVAGDHVIVGYSQNFGGGNAASVNNIPAVPASAPAANSLVATDATDKLPVTIIPVVTPQMLAVEGVDSQLVNSGIDFWQRGNGPFTTGVWGPDRWKLGIVGTDTLSVSKDTVNVDIGSLADAVCTFTLGTGGGSTYLINQLQLGTDGYQLAGRTVSLSMRIRTSTANAVRISINSDGTGSSSAYSGYHTGSGTYQTLTVSYTVPTNASLVQCFAYFSASCTAYIDNAMLVIGSVAEDYVSLPPADGLARCQRYYEAQGFNGGSLSVRHVPNAAVSFGQTITCYPKTITPTITKVGTWGVTNCGQPAVTNGYQSGYEAFATATAAGSANFIANASGIGVTLEANP